jgi:hypothetical protein
VSMDTVLIPFLRETPLVDGEWLDQHVLELAEWGAMLQSKGYQLKEVEDQPLLASARFIQGDGIEAGPTEMKMLHQKAAQNLKRSPGRTRKINNRLYLNFDDYRTWRGRKIKGDLQKHVKDGLVTASWNKWINDHDGEDAATLIGIPVDGLSCYVGDYSYYSCPNGLEEQLRKRKQLLEDMQYWQCKPNWKEESIRDWKYALNKYVTELYAFQQAFASISNSYFDGHELLFLDLSRDLAEIVIGTENMVANFNEVFADTSELSERINLEAVRQSASMETTKQVLYIVDMAKAEALEALGDQKTAVELAGRHL